MLGLGSDLENSGSQLSFGSRLFSGQWQKGQHQLQYVTVAASIVLEKNGLIWYQAIILEIHVNLIYFLT